MTIPRPIIFILSSAGFLLLFVLGLLVLLAGAAIGAAFGVHTVMPTIHEMINLFGHKTKS